MNRKFHGLINKIRLMNQRKRALFLSVVALVEILAIMVVSTSAWVESISSIRIYTSYAQTEDREKEIGPNGTKGKFETGLFQRAELTNSDNIINLTEFFRPSGDFHMTAASSADGDTFYFPEVNGIHSVEADGENPAHEEDRRHVNNYRIGTISDKNVNYVSFTFRIKTACSLAFNEEPEVYIGTHKVENNLVRFSIGHNSEFHIYGAEEDEEEVVASDNGTKAQTTIRDFADYVKGNQRLFEAAADDLITISMWIQDDDYSEYSTYSGKEITVSKFSLVPVHAFTVKASSNKTESNAGGNVAINRGEYGATATAYVAYNQQIALHSAPKSTAGFILQGWSTAANGTKITDSDTEPFMFTVTQENINTPLFALFTDDSASSPIIYWAYVWYCDDDGAAHYAWYKLSDSDNDGTYSFVYKGDANSIIFVYCENETNNKTPAEMDTNGYGWSKKKIQTFDLSFPEVVGDLTYVATSRSTCKNDGATISSAKDGDTSTFTNDKVTGYWEHSKATVSAHFMNGCTSEMGALSAKLSYYSSTNSGNVTWYNTSTDADSSFVWMDGTSYTSTTGGVDNNNADNKYERKVTLKATQKTGFTFVGWFDNPTDDSNQHRISQNATVEITGPEQGEAAYYAKYINSTVYKTDTASTYSGNTIVLINHNAVGDSNYKYINMYQSGDSGWGTGFVEMTNTGFGKDYKNLYFYKLTQDVDNDNNITVQLAQQQSGDNQYIKYLQNGTQRGWQKVITGYVNNSDNMSNETYNALHISDVYYPEKLVRGETATIKAKATNGCPEYISEKGLSGSDTTPYKYYTLSYTVKNSNDTVIASKTESNRSSTSDSVLSTTWNTTNDLATGTYTLTVTLSDGIDSVSRTKTISVVE